MFDAVALAALLHLPTGDRTPSPSRSAPSAAVSFLRCVGERESHWQAHARNPHSSAAGYFQFLRGTWTHYAAHVPGASRYATADAAPPAVQWDVALLAVKWDGWRNWYYPGSPCNALGART